ncbi:MAG: glycosyltransferase family 4 protein [Thaumarchaeota archaeon]|nr:glycosyltransferase family 4 protein [Nitrososphaerota archaeon]
MKVLIISPTESGIGGIAQHVGGLVNFLKKNGNSVDILSSANTFTIQSKGLKNPSFALSAFLKTKFMSKYDIVHAHNLPSAFPMKYASGKKILTLHGIYSEQIDILHGKSLGRLSYMYQKKALLWADAITAVSKETHDYYTDLGCKVSLIPNAIDITSLPNKPQRLYTKQVIYAGRISKEKGILDLLEACKKFTQDVHILILGTGPEEEKVKHIANAQKNVHFMGSMSKEHTISLIRGSDVLVQPSLAEGISSTILEAMACKVPVIATRIGGNIELIKHNENGILVEPNSPQQLSDETLSLLENPEKSLILREQAFTRVQKYDWSSVGPLYLNLYESLVNN